MTVTDVQKDPNAHTMTVTSEWDAPLASVWQLWADPRKLERWWGPPSHPATVVEHDLTAGGRVRYYMTSPEGEKYHGLWDVVDVDAPAALTVIDKFADEDGTPAEGMPESTMRLSLTETATGSRMTSVTTFASLESLEQVLAMGMEEGLKESMGQMDSVLARS